jgi:hypothetical protein
MTSPSVKPEGRELVALLIPEEMAAILKWPIGKVRSLLAWRRDIHVVHVGTLKRVRQEDLQDFIDRGATACRRRVLFGTTNTAGIVWPSAKADAEFTAFCRKLRQGANGRGKKRSKRPPAG